MNMDVQEIVCDDVDWMHVAQYRDYWRALVKSNEILISIKGEKFLDYLKDCYLLTKDSAPCICLVSS
jgi:hypothetical protein